MTNLLDLRAAHPTLFYRQDWFDGEPFMRAVFTGKNRGTPKAVVYADPTDDFCGLGYVLPLAAELTAAYVNDPRALAWQRYLWCRDTDRIGQRVFVGGVCPANGHTFEIHRHLRITEKWGVAQW